MRKVWNPASDIWEFYYSAADIDQKSLTPDFPEQAAGWLTDPRTTLWQRLPHVARFQEIAVGLQSLGVQGDVCLVKITEEDTSEVLAFFVAFGCETSTPTPSRPIFLRLDVGKANWQRLHRLGFACPTLFQEFADTFPGLRLGTIDSPDVLLPPSKWNEVGAFFGRSSTGHVFVPETIRDNLDDYLIIQSNYWGVLTLLSKAGDLWLANSAGDVAAPTDVSIAAWIDRELSGGTQPRHAA